MSLVPLLSSSPIIQIHAYCAVAAFGLGAVQFASGKGNARHRTLGRIWVVLMAVTALSSFFIWTIRTWGPFSPIHILSLVTLAGLWRAIAHARAGDIAAHRALMRMLYLGALVVAGLFTFAPGRIMNRVVFGPDGAGPLEWAVFGLAVFLVAAAAFVAINRRRQSPRRAYAR